MEAEIARKKEHLNVATNFAAARGWTRTCWKSKNHLIMPKDHERDFLYADTSDEDNADVTKGEVDSPDSPARLGRAMSTDVAGAGLNMSKLRASQQSTHVTKVYDLAADTKEYGYRLSTEDMVKQLTAIDEHNLKLPPRKKAKESLPEISAPNVNCKTIVSRDHKKGIYNYLRKYENIGFIDPSTNDQENPRGPASAFSVTAQARAI